MSAITAKASRKMKKYAVLTREPRCFLGSFDFSWEQRKLSELTSMHARIGWQNLRTSEFLDSGNYMLITGTDFNDGAINFSTCHYVERERYEQDRHIQIHNGSILITKDGTLGKVAYVQGLSMPATLNAGVFNVQIKDANNVDEKYLFQYLKAPFLMDYVDKKATGGTIKHLNQSILVDFPVILPQRSEQTLIGAFFQQLDNLITLHQRKCALLFSPFQALISMMFTTSTFSWEQRKFEEIAVRSSVICSDDTLPRVEYEDIVSGAGRLNKDIYAKQSSKSGIAFHQGDVLYGKLRPYLQNWLLPTFDGLAVGDFWVLQPQNADSSFLYRLIQSRQFDEVANQSTGTKMPRADWKLVSKTVFSIPSNISEQAAIGTYFTALDSLTDSNLNHTGIYLYSKGKIMIHLTFDYQSDEGCTTPGQYLRYHRTFQGLTTRELAEKVGVVPATLVLYENDRHPIKHSTAVALANVLGIDRSRLLDEYTVFVDYPYSSLLKKVRRELSFTQMQMAEVIGIGQTTYSGWEREVRVPRRKEHEKILAAMKKLKVDVDTYLCQPNPL